MAHDVFVSYSNKDKPVADAVVANLESKGIRCWIAPRDVTPGTSWGEAILDAIESSQVMVVILSQNSNKSNQVVREVERAVANEVIIIPFRIENIDPSGAMAYFLSTEHWLDAITPPLEEHIEKLGNTIQLFLAEGDRSLVEDRLSKPLTPTKPTPRWWPQPLVPLLAVIILVAVLSLIFGPQWGGSLPFLTKASPTVTIAPTETLPSATPTPTPPPDFSVLGEYRTSRSANALYVANNILNLANGGDGLVRLYINDPENLGLVDTFPVGDAQEVAVFDEIAFVISGEHDRKLNIIELKEDGETAIFPPEGERLGPVNSIYNVVVEDNLVHLAGHNYWGIIDITDPMQPVELHRWETPSNSGNPCTVATDGTIAYVGGGWTGLHIFDFTDPENPELIGRFDTPHWIIQLDIVDDILYLTMGEGGLMSIDVSNPAQPLLMDRLDLPGFAMELSLAGETLYVTYSVREEYETLESGVIAVDVSDPEALTTLATFNDMDEASDVQAMEDTIFVTDQSRGVLVLGFQRNP
jgi:hypothetical protein